MTVRVFVNDSYATTGALRDIDGACARIVLNPDRRKEEHERIELVIESPALARRLARELNRWAKIVSAL